MRKIPIILLLVLAIFTPLASADIVNDMDSMVDDYNDNVGSVPSYLLSLLGDEVIQLTIIGDDGDELYVKVVTEDGYITEFEEIDEDEDIGATMVVGADESAVRTVLHSSHPLDAFISAKDNGLIVVEPVGFVNSVEYAVTDVILGVTSLFS